MEARIFKWSCLAVAAVTCGFLLYLLNDMRRELHRTNETINTHLPQILANVNTATTTLAAVSKDINSFRDLAGMVDTPQDRSLVAYADSILDFLEQQTTGQIGLTKVVGSGLKDVVTAAEWARAARKEALWLTFRASTRAELLERLGKTKFGSDWYYLAPGIAPTKLVDFLVANHLDSKSVSP
ncbi:MAG TPA: hypothetical protein VK427_02795 [Kofleriaceae bacterium]|nr:hypothetical protein [Kofleriaceae bacterium]